MKNLPHFIGIGAQRAGTSWLYNALKQHPEVFMPRKEMHFFDNDYDNGLESYFSEFLVEGAEGKLCGEITPDYLNSPRAVQRIANDLPDSTKLFIILREPLERAKSAVNLYKSHGRYKELTVEQVLEKESFIVEQSLYAQQVEQLFSLVDKSRVFICLFDAIESQPAKVFKEICEFLEISPEHVPKSITTKMNTSSMQVFQSKYNLPKIQKRIAKSFLGPAFYWFKRTRMFGVLKNWLIRRSLANEQNIYHSVSKEISSRLIKDIDLLAALTKLPVENWKQRYVNK